MCVWASIKPGKPVYFERPITSAPGGGADESDVTLRILLPSMTTMAFVHNLPLASHNLPKRTAFTAFAAGFSCADACAASPAATNTPEITRFHRMKPSRRHTYSLPCRPDF